MSKHSVECFVMMRAIWNTSFRPAPTARTLQAWPCLQCRSQLAGGTPPGPPGTHAWSQFWYSCWIPVLVHSSHLSSGLLLSSESSMLYLDLHLHHSTRFARPCVARGLISVLLLMFYLSYQSYTLACTNGMALAALGQLARGKPFGPPSPHI